MALPPVVFAMSTKMFTFHWVIFYFSAPAFIRSSTSDDL